MLWFPRPQLLIYTMLVIPAVYGGSKLSRQSSGFEALGSGVVGIVLLPLPIILTWVYVLFAHTWFGEREVQRSKSAIFRAYQSQTSIAQERSSATGVVLASGKSMTDASGQQRTAATLALLGDNNPTLIIRDRKPGEEVFDRFAMADESSEESTDDDEDYGAASRAAQLVTSRSGAAARSRPRREPAVSFESECSIPGQRQSIEIPRGELKLRASLHCGELSSHCLIEPCRQNVKNSATSIAQPFARTITDRMQC
jgi:hypothetical protein